MQTSIGYSSPAIHPVLKFITAKKYRWLRHTIFVGIGLVLAFKGDIDLTQKKNATSAATETLLLMDAILFLLIISMLYLITLVLIPRLLFRSKLPWFLLCCLMIVAVIYIALYLLDTYLLKPVLPASFGYQYTTLSVSDFIQKGLVVAILMASVTGVMVFKKWIIDLQKMNEIQQLNLRSELNQLKSQINPHFLFNTLNNLHVLLTVDPQKASQVLLGLSDLLRYQLYDAAREKILLSKDIDFINNLLGLEKIRKDDFEYEVVTEGNVAGVTLPPFIFIPFVENAIKHGASSSGHSYLKIHFKVTDDSLVFFAENSKAMVKSTLPGGIGLHNIKRRLELLYADTYHLEIKEDTAKFNVYLTIPL